MRVLFITSSLPYPPTTGAMIRIWHLLKQVGRQHEVTLLSLVGSAAEKQNLAYMEPYCNQIETVVKRRGRSRKKLLMRLLGTMVKGQPPQNGIAYYGEMANLIRDVTKQQEFDLIDVELTQMAPYIEFVANNRKAARLITLHNASGAQYQRMMKLERSATGRVLTTLDWLFLRRWEPDYVAQHFDKCVVVSEVDEALFRQANPSLNISVIPNGVDAAGYPVLPDRPDSKEILFIGKMNYGPNVDGALFFYSQVFPLIRNIIPDARLLIVGTEPTAEIQALSADPSVEVTGYVEDVVPYYDRSCVSVVPLRAGGGTRLKILESMALGRAVVSTTVGCEGLAVAAGEHLLIGDTPADLANQTVSLMNDADLRYFLTTNGRRLVETEYDWQVVGQRLLGVYEQVVNSKRSSFKR
jgi:polysaccharide biosynthesis protein PslH